MSQFVQKYILCWGTNVVNALKTPDYKCCWTEVSESKDFGEFKNTGPNYFINSLLYKVLLLLIVRNAPHLIITLSAYLHSYRQRRNVHHSDISDPKKCMYGIQYRWLTETRHNVITTLNNTFTEHTISTHHIKLYIMFFI